LGETTTAHEPPPIRQLSAPDLKALLESGAAIEVVDVQTEGVRAIATIDGARLLDQAYHDALLLHDRDTPIVFQCHHDVRSQQAAEYFRRQGSGISTTCVAASTPGCCSSIRPSRATEHARVDSGVEWKTFLC
jgi:rhodanese-related sulfurtransferase